MSIIEKLGLRNQQEVRCNFCGALIGGIDQKGNGFGLFRGPRASPSGSCYHYAVSTVAKSLLDKPESNRFFERMRRRADFVWEDDSSIFLAQRTMILEVLAD